MVNFMVNDVHASCRGDGFALHGYWEWALTAFACMSGQFNCRNVFMEFKVYVRCCSGQMDDVHGQVPAVGGTSRFISL